MTTSGQARSHGKRKLSQAVLVMEDVDAAAKAILIGAVARMVHGPHIETPIAADGVWVRFRTGEAFLFKSDSVMRLG